MLEPFFGSWLELRTRLVKCRRFEAAVLISLVFTENVTREEYLVTMIDRLWPILGKKHILIAAMFEWPMDGARRSA